MKSRQQTVNKIGPKKQFLIEVIEELRLIPFEAGVNETIADAENNKFSLKKSARVVE